MAITNYDAKTDCHYGVISYHSISDDALQSVFDGENLTYGEAVEQVKAELRSALRDYFSDYKWNGKESNLTEAVNTAFDAIEDDFSDDYQAEDEQYLYKADGYVITNSPSLVCLFITESPFYTLTRQCSPCAPNAGDLDNPDGDGIRTLCLSHDWFEDGTAPYPVYRVETGVLVEASGQVDAIATNESKEGN